LECALPSFPGLSALYQCLVKPHTPSLMTLEHITTAQLPLQLHQQPGLLSKLLSEAAVVWDVVVRGLADMTMGKYATIFSAAKLTGPAIFNASAITRTAWLPMFVTSVAQPDQTQQQRQSGLDIVLRTATHLIFTRTNTNHTEGLIPAFEP
jgi:hypothetical protein